MLQISPSIRIFFCNQDVDFRKGIDGLAAVCRNQFNLDPFQGTLFIFRNRNRSVILVLVYDGQGFWLFKKRLSKGKFQWWPDTQSSIDARQLHTLFWNGNPEKAKLLVFFLQVVNMQEKISMICLVKERRVCAHQSNSATHYLAMFQKITKLNYLIAMHIREENFMN